MGCHAHTGVVVVGEQKPAMSFAWVKPASPNDSGYSVIYSELDPGDPNDATPSDVICLGCLLEEGDEQLGRGMELAKVHGQVDYDPATDEWFVPDDARWAQGDDPNGSSFFLSHRAPWSMRRGSDG
jgi:hypothetical protein